jgi:hypothetical protein
MEITRTPDKRELKIADSSTAPGQREGLARLKTISEASAVIVTKNALR